MLLKDQQVARRVGCDEADCRLARCAAIDAWNLGARVGGMRKAIYPTRREPSRSATAAARFPAGAEPTLAAATDDLVYISCRATTAIPPTWHRLALSHNSSCTVYTREEEVTSQPMEIGQKHPQFSTYPQTLARVQGFAGKNGACFFIRGSPRRAPNAILLSSSITTLGSHLTVLEQEQEQRIGRLVSGPSLG